MTIRDRILRQSRVANTVWIAGTAGAALCFFSARFSPALRWVMFPGILCFVIAVSGSLYRMLGITCPQCEHRLGALPYLLGTRAEVEPLTKCPSCGTSFDEDTEAPLEV